MMKWIAVNLTVVISAGALLVSAVALVHTWFTNRRNNRRWDSINLSRLVIRNLRITGWKTMKRAEFDNTDWGYNDRLGLAFVDEVGNVDLEQVIVPIQVVTVHPVEGVLTGLNCLTVTELLNGLQKNGISPEGLEFQKLIRIVFFIENVGATAASDVSFDVSSPVVDPSLSTKKGPSKFTIQPSEQYWASTSMRFPLAEPFPKELTFSINLSHVDANGHKHEDYFEYVFEKTTGTFRRA